MRNEGSAIRDEDAISESLIWPNQGMAFDPEESRRHLAIATVLQTIPQDAFEKLESTVDSWQWFIPHSEIHGLIFPFPATVYPRKKRNETLRRSPYAKVLYLAPVLEKAAFDIIVGIVAHELAHIALGHELFNHNDQYDRQEEEAWALITTWGFKKEARKCLAVNRAKNTRQIPKNKR